MSVLEKVKELREVTGAGMQDCKNALKENDNNIEKSIDYLRKKGVLKAAKKSSRDAAEGLIIVGENLKIDNSTVKDSIVNLVSKIGENIKLRRFKNIKKNDLKTGFYIHNKASDTAGKIISVIRYKSKEEKSKKLADNVCMHIAAMSPMALDEKGLDKNFIEKEKKIIEEQLDKKEKKPEILEKIISGKLNKAISENTLLNQSWVIDQDLTVKKAIEKFNKDNDDNFEIIDFHKFKVGEGIEIKKMDFSEEVKSLTK
ncbi:MAG: translation elongation factor Ts [Pelagibacteraceae bacterium]